MTERRLVLLLPLTVGLTILCFVTASELTQRQLHGVEANAQHIAAKTVPAIYHLSKARTELLQLELLLDARHKLPAGAAPGELARALREFDAQWTGYASAAPPAGTRKLRAQLEALREQLHGAVEQAARSNGARVAEPPHAPALHGLIAQLDDRLEEAVERHGRTAAELGREISASTAASRRLAVGLGIGSTLLAALSGALVLQTTRRYLRALRERMSDLEDFAGRLAHDIRDPLSCVGIALALAARPDAAQDPRTHALLERAQHSLRRVSEILEGLLAFARAGSTPLAAPRTEVAPVLASVLDEHAEAARAQQIELRAERLDACAVACSAGVLASVLANLVGNAIKYMGPAQPRRIGVRVLARVHRVRIEVQDSGPGVPPQLARRIFDPHVRAANASVPGLGLGLATVRRLVEAHGGAVGVLSASPGSVFWFELPPGTDRPAPDPAHPREPAARPPPAAPRPGALLARVRRCTAAPCAAVQGRSHPTPSAQGASEKRARLATARPEHRMRSRCAAAPRTARRAALAHRGRFTRLSRT